MPSSVLGSNKCETLIFAIFRTVCSFSGRHYRVSQTDGIHSLVGLGGTLRSFLVDLGLLNGLDLLGLSGHSSHSYKCKSFEVLPNIRTGFF